MVGVRQLGNAFSHIFTILFPEEKILVHIGNSFIE
jgi:hypothetical protein